VSSSELFTKPEQLVGKILPNVYIDRITLEGGGRTVREINPHIDYPGEGMPIGPGDSDELTVTINLVIKDFIQNGLSSWLSGHLFNTDQGEPRTIKDYINVTVIQTTNEDATKRFSEVQKLEDWPKSTNLRAYKGTSFQTFPLTELISAPDDYARKDFDPDKMARYYKEITGAGDEVMSITKTVQWPSDQAKYTGNQADLARTSFKKDIEHLAYFTYSYFDFDRLAKDFNFMGLKITDNLFKNMNMMSRMTSDIAVRNFETVSVAYVFVTEDNDLWTGPIQHFPNSEQKSAVSGFDPAGNQIFQYTGWMGGESYNVPQNPDQLRNLSTTSQPRLKRIEVPNQTVQDLRVSDNIQKLVLDFSIIENEVLSAIVKKPTQDPLPFTIKTSYFTSLSLARDPSGNSKFFFGVDLRKLIRDNSVYGQMFLNNVNINKIMDKTKILSLKIIRRRIEGSSEATDSPYTFPSNKGFSPITKPREFNSFRMNNNGGISTRVFDSTSDPDQHYLLYGDKTDEIIIEANEDPEGNLRYFSVDGISKIEPIPHIYAPTKQVGGAGDSDPGIIYFSGFDGTIKKQTDGYYKYIVEMEIQSIVVDFLVEKRQEITTVKNELLEYYNEGSKLGFNGMNAPKSDDPHITDKSIANSPLFEEANFDMIANRFTQQFINWTKVQYKDKNPPWIKAPSTYLRVLMLFPEGYKALMGSKNVTQVSVRARLFGAMKTYLDPENGNLQGVLAVLQLLERLEDKFDQAIGVELGRPRAKQEDGSTAGSSNTVKSDIDDGGQGSLPIKYFKVKNEFDKIFDANIPKNIGYYMMDIGGAAGLGLKMVSPDDFVKSVRQEKEKIFTQGSHNLSFQIGDQIVNPNDTLETTDYSYFTPAIVKSKNGGDIRLIGSSPISPTSLTSLASAGIDTMYAAAGSLDNSTLQRAPTIEAQNRMGLESAQEGSMGGSGQSQLQTQDNGLAGNLANFMALNWNLTIVPEFDVEIPLVGPGENEQEPDLDMTHLLDDCPVTPAPSVTSGDIYLAVSEFDQRANERYFTCQQAFASLLSVSQLGASLPSNPTSGLTPIQPPRSMSFYSPFNAAGAFSLGISPPSLRVLPNNLKALVGYNCLASPTTAPTAIFQNNIMQMFESDPFSGIENSTRSKYLFDIIYTLEVLTGYKSQKFGPNGEETSVKLPIWKPLTRTIFDEAKTQYLLCRLRPYSNTQFGIDTKVDLNFPVLEECFLLQGSGARTLNGAIRRQDITALTPDLDLSSGLGFANNSQYQTSNSYLYRNSPSDAQRSARFPSGISNSRPGASQTFASTGGSTPTMGGFGNY